jgi:hypothetical protein
MPAGVKCVMIEQWRDYAYRQGIADSDDPAARRQSIPSSASVSSCEQGRCGLGALRLADGMNFKETCRDKVRDSDNAS